MTLAIQSKPGERKIFEARSEFIVSRCLASERIDSRKKSFDDITCRSSDSI
jgi:hypothetical protein